MTAGAGAVARRLRRWAHALRHSPLHPQWFAFRYKELAARGCAEQAQGDVLDIGCADGALRERLDAAVRYTGLDYPATASGLYRTRPGVFGDAQQLPFAAQSFDCVIVLDVLEHLPQPERALQEARRVLRPGGRVLIHVPFAYPLHDRPFDFWRLTEYGLAAIGARAGLGVDCISARGHALETAGLLLNLALAQGLLAATAVFRPLLVFGVLLLPLVVLVNLFCWTLARLLPAVDFLPLSYWAVLVRGGDADAS